jgi:uncharacterized SAM-binding protein YcdF (DUF218 family)
MFMKVKESSRLFGVLLLKKGLLAVAFALAAAAFGLSTPLVAGVMFDALQSYPALAPSQLAGTAAGSPMAIVILSAGRRSSADEYGEAFNNQAPDALTLERMRYGVFLARKTGLPILVSGGTLAPGTEPVARTMANTLQSDYGIQPKWIEDRSTTTAENASLSSKILRRAGVARVMLVTHAWHMKRALKAFSASGLSVTPAPTAFYFPSRTSIWDLLTPSVATFRMSGYAIHEIVGGLWYKVRYGY